MSKFTKVFDLWAEDENGVSNLQKIKAGELVIQRGQWVRISGDKPSRWVGISPGGSVWAVHYQGGRRHGGKCRQRSQFMGQARLAREQWDGTDAERRSAYITRREG